MHLKYIHSMTTLSNFHSVTMVKLPSSAGRIYVLPFNSSSTTQPESSFSKNKSDYFTTLLKTIQRHPDTLKIKMPCYGLGYLLDSSSSSLLVASQWGCTYLISFALAVLYVVKSTFIDIFMNDSPNFVSL